MCDCSKFNTEYKIKTRYNNGQKSEYLEYYCSNCDKIKETVLLRVIKRKKERFFKKRC